MKQPTNEEVKTEIATLKEMKPRVLRRSMFGDDHHAAIDAQLDVMENLLTGGLADSRVQALNEAADAYFAATIHK